MAQVWTNSNAVKFHEPIDNKLYNDENSCVKAVFHLLHWGHDHKNMDLEETSRDSQIYPFLSNYLNTIQDWWLFVFFINIFQDRYSIIFKFFKSSNL